jgi:hypothetical protein
MELGDLSLVAQKCSTSLISAHKLLEIKSDAECMSQCALIQEITFNRLWISLLRDLPRYSFAEGGSDRRKTKPILRSLCENLETRMLTTKAAQYWRFLIKQNSRQIQIFVLETTPSEIWASFSTWRRELFNNAFMLFALCYPWNQL